MNRVQNRVRDSGSTLVQAPSIDSRNRFAERVMYEKALVIGLIIASLTNVVCLYGYL